MYTPHYIITNKLLKSIGVIEGCREVIQNAPLVPAWEKKFQEDAIVRQVHHGTHLEGNPLNFTEAAKVIGGQEVMGKPRDIQEIINYRNVLTRVGELVSQSLSSGKRFAVDEDFIKLIHRLTTEKILPPEKCGVFRITQVVVKNSVTGEVTFRPPVAVEVPFLIEELLWWLNGSGREIHPIIQSGIAQYELVRIHPFVDGNGRVARAIATLVLYNEGYDIRKFFSLEEYYDRNSADYYKALQAVSNQQLASRSGPTTDNRKPDITPWLEYFAEGLSIELARIKERVRKLSVDVHLKERLGGKQFFLNERQIKIMEHVQTTGFLQNQMFNSLFPMISEDTMLREVQDLIEKGILVKSGKTKGARYVLP